MDPYNPGNGTRRSEPLWDLLEIQESVCVPWFPPRCPLAVEDTVHIEIIVQLGYNSGHIANPFSPLFYPHRLEYHAPFHLMCPRINNPKILDPL